VNLSKYFTRNSLHYNIGLNNVQVRQWIEGLKSETFSFPIKTFL